MPGIASAATAVVIGHIAGGTKAIRVGSGGIMLPNHPPLVIAEQFGTLGSLYPGRIDLAWGVPRGPIPSRCAHYAETLREERIAFPKMFENCNEIWTIRNRVNDCVRFPVTVRTFRFGCWDRVYLAHSSQRQWGCGLHLLRIFAPADLMAALRLYRNSFKPSAQLEKPYAMVGMNVFAAETDVEAQYQFSSLEQSFTLLRRGTPGRVPPPIENMDSFWSPRKKRWPMKFCWFQS